MAGKCAIACSPADGCGERVRIDPQRPANAPDLDSQVSRGPSPRSRNRAGTTMNVAQWLNAIDLRQYETLFREHEIDADVLPDLVEADPRKRSACRSGIASGSWARAIAALSAGGTLPSAAKACLSAQPSPSPPTSRPRPNGGRSR